MSVLTTLPLVEAERRARLEKIARRTADITKQRDLEIARAYLAGASFREIAEAVGLSHTGVKKIIDRTRVIGVKLDGPQKSMPLKEALQQDIFDIEIVYFTEDE